MASPSTLSRLFHFARAPKNSPEENFTTEALAAAIRADPSPLREALACRGLALPAGELLRVDTQVWIAGVGQLDLVLQGAAPDGLLWLVAFEIKVDAKESGQQLTNYVTWRARAPTSRHVFVLSRQPVDGWDEARRIRWQDLWNVIRRTELHLYWTDLSRWLEELSMADNSYEPILLGDVGSLRGVRLLMKKLAHILEPVTVALNQTWANSNWPTGDDILRQLEGRFCLTDSDPTFSIEHRRAYKDAGVAVGLFDGAHGLELGIWIWANPRRVGLHDGLREAVAHLFDAETPVWARPDAPWLLARASHPAETFSDQDSASRWLVERVTELANRSVFGAIESTGNNSL